MHDEQRRLALAALEVVLRGVLRCESFDSIEIVTSDEDDGLPKLHGFSVTRESPATGEQCRVRFLDIQPPIEIDGKYYAFGSYLINAANIFIRELFIPGFRGQGHSVEKMIACSREIDLEAELADESSHIAAEKRLYPRDLSQ